MDYLQVGEGRKRYKLRTRLIGVPSRFARTKVVLQVGKVVDVFKVHQNSSKVGTTNVRVHLNLIFSVVKVTTNSSWHKKVCTNVYL